jgi:hypothetical protein
MEVEHRLQAYCFGGRQRRLAQHMLYGVVLSREDATNLVKKLQMAVGSLPFH